MARWRACDENCVDQVWSAVATGDIEPIRAAFRQGLAVSFPLSDLGPHSRPRDAASSKTPLHLVSSSACARCPGCALRLSLGILTAAA